MVATLTAGREDCPPALDLDGHGNPTSPAHHSRVPDPAAGRALEDFGAVTRAIDALDC